jgi:subtilisin family serine protease
MRYDSRQRPLFKWGEILVKFNKGVKGDLIARLHAVAGNRVIKSSSRSNLHLVGLKPGLPEDEALALYRSSSLVKTAERHVVRYKAMLPNDTDFRKQWGLHNTGQKVNGTTGTYDADIDAPEAWEITQGSQGIVIAVVDTGVDYNHPDLSGGVWTNAREVSGNSLDDDNNGYVDDIRGWDFASSTRVICFGGDCTRNDNDPMDVDGHGTHVAGIIAARGNNDIGIAGICWGQRLWRSRCRPTTPTAWKSMT